MSFGFRSRSLLTAVCAFIVALCALPVAAQDQPPSWQPLGSPAGAITHLTSSPDGKTLYAVSVARSSRRDDQTQWSETGQVALSDALYRSSDSGATWQPLTNDLIPGPIGALYADSATDDLYVGVQGLGDAASRRYGLWRSADRGRNWRQVSLGQPTTRNDLIVRRITRNANGRWLLLGATDSSESPNSYVFRSSDNGRTWTAFEPLRVAGQLSSMLTDLVPHPTVPERLFITTYGSELLASTDTGQTWTRVDLPELRPDATTSPAQIAIRPDRPGIALAARSSADGPALARSTDGGRTWNSLAASGLPERGGPRALSALPGGIFLLNTTSGTYRSADDGRTWQPLEGMLSSGQVAEFLALPDRAAETTEVAGAATVQTVLAATGYGIFASRDRGAVWQALGSGLPFNSSIAGLLTHSARPGLVYAISDGRFRGSAAPPMVLRSNDGGQHWTPAAQGLPEIGATVWALDPKDPDVLYVASWDYLFRSTDGGVSWQITRLETSSRKAIAIAPADPSTIYLGGQPAQRSTDRGATWQSMPIVTAGQARQTQDVTGLVVDPADARHLWAALDGGGVFESRDGGQAWQPVGLSGRAVRWLALSSSGLVVSGAADKLTLYAGVSGDGIYRWDSAAASWFSAAEGLPAQSTILAFAVDNRTPDTLWASRDGGGIYFSADRGENWANVSVGVGDNLASALAVDYSEAGGMAMGTAEAGFWALRSNAPASASPKPLPNIEDQAGVDARIEILWPHNWASVTEAKQANLGLRLFVPGSLLQPACGWQPKVNIWQAVDTSPAAPLDYAKQRSVDGQPFPYWELNDIDVSQANDPARKLYFMVRVDGVDTATSIWVHGADPRTYFPQQDVPSGVATDDLDAVDARIEIVWPHDGAGNPRSVADGTHANIAVALFKHGTRLSVPVGWQPAELVLYGAWDQEVSRALSRTPVALTRQSGAITYPVWEFHNVSVARATDPTAKLYLWANVTGTTTYPTIWAHGADPRTFFPAKDEPIQGCVP